MAENEKPLVSVIVPAYNVGPYIAETLESIFAQTYKNIEIIIGYGNSSDNTKAVLEPYIKSGSVKLVEQTVRGLSNARNIALAQAKGEFIALLDADDTFMPTRIEKQVAYFLAHPKCDLCYCDVWHFRNNEPEKMLKLNYTYYSGDNVLPELLKRNFIAPSSVMLRRSVIDRVGPFNEQCKRSEDWEYWMRLAHNGAEFCFLPEILGKLRLHPGSMSSGWVAKKEERQTNIRILTALRAEMTPDERSRFHIDSAIFHHRLRLWYTYFGNYFTPLQSLHKWIQKNRLK